MVRSVHTLPIFIIVLLVAVDVKAQTTEWQQTQPENFGNLSTELKPALDKYLGKNIVVDQIITSSDNNDKMDDHQYAIFVQVEENNKKVFYTIESHTNSTGKLTVTFARQTNVTGWQQIVPRSYGYLATDLQQPLSTYLGENVIVNQVVTAVDNGDAMNDHKYLIFAQVEKGGKQVFYTVEAYIGSSVEMTVTYARPYGS